jgi:hypothetical protein
MKIKAKRTKDGFFIPLIDQLKDKEEIIVEIYKEPSRTEFVEFLYKIYDGKDNISKFSDEEMLNKALREKYGL